MFKKILLINLLFFSSSLFSNEFSVNNCFEKISDKTFILKKNEYSEKNVLKYCPANIKDLAKLLDISTVYKLKEEMLLQKNKVRVIYVVNKFKENSSLNFNYIKENSNLYNLEKKLKKLGFTVKFALSDKKREYLFKEKINLNDALKEYVSKNNLFLDLDFKNKEIEIYNEKIITFDVYKNFTEMDMINKGLSLEDIKQNKENFENLLFALEKQDIHYEIKENKLYTEKIDYKKNKNIQKIIESFNNNVRFPKNRRVILNSIEDIKKLVENNISLRNVQIKISMNEFFEIILFSLKNNEYNYQQLASSFLEAISNLSYKIDNEYLRNLLNTKDVKQIKYAMSNKLYIKKNRYKTIKTYKEFLKFYKDNNFNFIYKMIFEDLLMSYYKASITSSHIRKSELEKEIKSYKKKNIENIDKEFFYDDFDKNKFKTVKRYLEDRNII